MELKLVLNRTERETIMDAMHPHLRADENATSGAHYPVVSLYYDSPQRDCYWEKAFGQTSRRKLRVRVYGTLDGALPPTCFVEVKHKCDGRNLKRRVQLPLASALAVAAGGPPCRPLDRAEQRIVTEVHQLVRDRAFAPSCCMRYDRQAFAGRDPHNDLRVTFDTRIAYRFDQLTPEPDDQRFSHHLLPEGSAVLEIKLSGNAPLWLSQLIGRSGALLRSHSKYCSALERGDHVLAALAKTRPRITATQNSPTAPAGTGCAY
jgi:hypothetical protein